MGYPGLDGENVGEEMAVSVLVLLPCYCLSMNRGGGVSEAALEGGVYGLAVVFKYQQSFSKIVDFPFNSCIDGPCTIVSLQIIQVLIY